MPDYTLNSNNSTQPHFQNSWSFTTPFFLDNRTKFQPLPSGDGTHQIITVQSNAKGTHTNVKTKHGLARSTSERNIQKETLSFNTSSATPCSQYYKIIMAASIENTKAHKTTQLYE